MLIVMRFFLLFASALGHNADRGAKEAVFFTDLIFKIAQVGEVHQLGLVDIDQEGRRV